MKTVLSPHPEIDTPDSVVHLAKTWMSWAVFFFLIASLFGLLLRSFQIGLVPDFFDFIHILHAHSHIALLGWGYLLVSGMMVFLYVKDSRRLKTYRILLTVTVIANLGMMLSFPFQGYGLYSIIFSTLHLLISYAFAYHFLRDLKKTTQNTDTRLLRWAVIWMVVSSLGLWAIAPIGAILGKTHHLYHLSVQWFLHFQLNGWFVYGLLGMIIFFLKKSKIGLLFSSTKQTLLNLSLLLTFSSTIYSSIAWETFYYLNVLGVILQGFVYYWLLFPAFKLFLTKFNYTKNWTDWVIFLGIISLGIKALIQMLLIIPNVLEVSHHIRSFVVGFIHLVLLGAITFGIGGLAVQKKLMPANPTSQRGWWILALGFTSSELILFIQGTMIWGQFGSIPYYFSLIFLSSTLFPIGLGMIFVSFWLKKGYQTLENTPFLK
ncbi:hypothetical protein [Mongoliibacter ruber]|uniref:Uncharacterized protein n=1 Tax=Mongoliibacter ruber TaxID=1750599 RepID=A0A2T0WLN9_9BACT|nr:hypothetical protein [Mongoliibacter ruber]PRY87623.1 hypothetical protein CLW00_106250 [Mongoliibacter ruber]